MTCIFRDRLDDALLGEVPRDEHRQILDHVMRCPDCALEWATLERTMRHIRDEVDQRAPCPGLADRIVEAIDDDVVVVSPAILSRWTWLRPRMILSAAAAIIVFFVVFSGAHEAHRPETRASSFVPITIPVTDPHDSFFDQLKTPDGSVLQLTWGDGVQLEVIGPAVLRRGDDGPYLVSGDLTCHVSPEAIPFAVTTTDARIEVRGTSFRVIRRDPDEGTLLSVSRGAVAVIPADGERIEIVRAGHDRRIGGRILVDETMTTDPPHHAPPHPPSAPDPVEDRYGTTPAVRSEEISRPVRTIEEAF